MNNIFTYKPRVLPEQTQWEIGVFPFTSVNGVVTEWNSVVRRKPPGAERTTVTVLPAHKSPERARAHAENWLNANRT